LGHEHGHPDDTVRLTPFWPDACSLMSAEGLDFVSSWLESYPDTDVVHFSLGGNDILNRWTPAQAGSGAEDALVDQIVGCMEVVFDHISSVQPGADIVWSSYDYLRPIELGSPPQINGVLDKLAEAAARFADIERPRVHTVDIVGTLQTTYGFDGLQYTSFDPPHAIPPGDPSLPDPSLPSPYEAFPSNDPTHPVPEANRAMATAQYEGLYAVLLNDLAFQINPGLNDAWYNPATPGQGFLISVFPDIEQMFVAWFTFDSERPPEDVGAMLGEPGHRWLTAQGPYDGDTAELTVFVTEGGVFDDAEPPAVTDPAGDGTMTIEFADCNAGLVSYEITSLGLSGEIPIERIVLDNVARCEALANP
jgi:hypothetical protein